MSEQNVKRLFKVLEKNLFTIHSTMDYDRITDTLIVLADTLANTETDETIWYIGESSYCCLDDLIVGAYWHFSHWHGGQYSKSYLALCALGRIFNPGMTSEEKENDTYILLNELAEKEYN